MADGNFVLDQSLVCPCSTLEQAQFMKQVVPKGMSASQSIPYVCGLVQGGKQ